jgi:dTDP-4-amino-4,6-dideoxygalactose transaminase
MRIKNAEYLNSQLSQIDFISGPIISDLAVHVYYLQPFKYNFEVAGIHRNKFIDAIKAELPSSNLREDTPLIGSGYVRPLYLQPLYQQRATHCSFNCSHYQGQVSYDKGTCPIAEKLHFEELFTHEFMRPGMSSEDLNDVVEAFYKVSENISELI